MKTDEHFLREAIRLARDNSAHGGRPFGAVVVKDDEIIATGVNQILATCDPTSHAELNAIRAASKKIGSPSLAGCRVYASGHPCPMCLAAMRMAGVSDIAYAYSNEDGAPYGLSTAAIYTELARPLAEQSLKMRHVPARLEDSTDLYAEWKHRQTPSA
ncbi:nucleoside deaminase [Uliginosibacterium sp. sgz301328]|uniref:nucleoside deaminase n=1 Tax=Uliginosibacterium sp. sgz301328 TaxID=3243764 RepID=UPI00359EAC33